ncbi:thioredoxin-like fold domain-containing protein MRL7L homolog, chloroplastic isoform X1 [Phoenix dactylifera]|uniref:Thioredoxin-like fold domain-containing protein MRL7L homolog, chloroplastic isoform X1 n=1 Tax=Phoenix dactylifera TaxID=42345 RepID=A0A8B7BZ33_PHODC|nr:thioredoxin-like fold domain-containing protein MRL7L homolog, chloroplastic isoform X1 [Phoenix dactylifera]XP_008788277.3 thioredoxin-like fold domain-containing protein MRL7L homolog, chloroplastic isoform X1 [Phoenix dactylifera]
MALQCPLLLNCSTPVPREETHLQVPLLCARSVPLHPKSHGSFKPPSPIAGGFVPTSPKLKVRASKAIEVVLGDGKDDEDTDSDEEEKNHGSDDGPSLMTEEERKEMRRKIREVLDNAPDAEEETDPVQRKIKMQKLLADYPLVVEEDDPDWPEDADGWGFNFDQFFDKITIKNVRKDDDEDYDSDKEIVWQDDNYIRPIHDITARQWEDTVFKDFNPLIILVHHRYKKPEENERARSELERAVQMFWESGLPSPRCAAVDACVEHDLVDALQVSGFPEILFTHAGKILHRDKVVRTADEWSKIMAFFFYKAGRPSFLDKSVGQSCEKIPSLK